MEKQQREKERESLRVFVGVLSACSSTCVFERWEDEIVQGDERERERERERGRECETERRKSRKYRATVHPRGGHSACVFYVEIESLTAFDLWKFLREIVNVS